MSESGGSGPPRQSLPLFESGRPEQPLSNSTRPRVISVSPESRLAVTLAQVAMSPLFANVPAERLASILPRCNVKRLDRHGVLIAPGDQDDRMYLLLEGRLRVHLNTVDDDPLTTLEPGDSAGELSLIDNHPRSAYVVADEDSRLLEITRDDFWDLAEGSRETLINLLRVLAARLRGSNSTVSESLRLQQEYKRHAAVDSLTGLYNRRWLDQVLPRQLKRSAMQNDPLTVVMIDVDHFKSFNDRYGHQAGDFVLFAVARVLTERFRPTDLAARYGGEEFTVVLPNTDLAGARVAAERVREAIAGTELRMTEDALLPSVTASMGLAELAPGQDAAQLLAAADTALYQAKEAGRNCVKP